ARLWRDDRGGEPAGAGRRVRTRARRQGRRTAEAPDQTNRVGRGATARSCADSGSSAEAGATGAAASGRGPAEARTGSRAGKAARTAADLEAFRRAAQSRGAAGPSGARAGSTGTACRARTAGRETGGQGGGVIEV